MRLVTATFERFTSWINATGSPLPLAVIRIAIGLLTFLQFALLYPHLQTFYGEQSFVPLAANQIWTSSYLSPNFLRNIYSDTSIFWFWLSSTLAALCMTVGLFSRTATVLTWVAYMSFMGRNPYILDGVDLVLRAALFILIWARCGAALSVDRKLFAASSNYAQIPLWPQWLFQVQLSTIYLSSVVYKVMSVSWIEGSTVCYILKLPEFKHLPIPDFLTLNFICTSMTYAVLIVEVAMGLALFLPRYRKWIIPCGIMLHLGMEWSLNIPFFSLATLALYFSFLDRRQSVANERN